MTRTTRTRTTTAPSLKMHSFAIRPRQSLASAITDIVTNLKDESVQTKSLLQQHHGQPQNNVTTTIRTTTQDGSSTSNNSPNKDNNEDIVNGKSDHSISSRSTFFQNSFSGLMMLQQRSSFSFESLSALGERLKLQDEVVDLDSSFRPSFFRTRNQEDIIEEEEQETSGVVTEEEEEKEGQDEEESKEKNNKNVFSQDDSVAPSARIDPISEKTEKGTTSMIPSFTIKDSAGHSFSSMGDFFIGQHESYRSLGLPDLKEESSNSKDSNNRNSNSVNTNDDDDKSCSSRSRRKQERRSRRKRLKKQMSSSYLEQKSLDEKEQVQRTASLQKRNDPPQRKRPPPPPPPQQQEGLLLQSSSKSLEIDDLFNVTSPILQDDMIRRKDSSKIEFVF